jgi:outer membrane protein OmpA-like peptidoglycan-associated protein
MATPSLLDSISGLVDRNMLSNASSLLGESEPAVSKGLGAAIPTLLAALVRKTDDPGATRQLSSLIQNSAADSVRVPGELGSILSGSGPSSSIASQLLASLFGDRSSGLAAALASFAGLRPGSASSLLSLAAPLVLSVLGNRTRAEGVGAEGLARWLGGERTAIESAVPASLTKYLEPQRRTVSTPLPPVRRETERRRIAWLWPLLGLLVLGGLWALLRPPAEPRVAQRLPVATPAPVAAAPPVTRALTLPGGATLDAPGRFEGQFLTFLRDPNGALGDDTWFAFDGLHFETDSAVLKPASRAQLQNVAAILRAYPSVRVKIGGYTDNQGDPNYNLQLSQQRAESVTRELAALGIDASRIESEGYGEQHPVASNDTETGRAQNRRIAMRVVAR